MSISKHKTITIYEANPNGRFRINFRELWNYRELLFFLTLRDIQVRYKQAYLGVAWAVIQPLLSMIVFSLIFGLLAKVPSEGIPYPVFSYVALIPWQFFSGALSRAGISLVNNRSLLTKVYFPRMIIPLSAVLAGLVELLISIILLLGLSIIFKVPLSPKFLWIFPLIFLAFLTSFAAGLWISALNVKYRDFEHALPFLIQIWFYASPIVYSTELIPDGIWQIVYGLNPMAGVIQGFRWAILGASPPESLFWVSCGIVVLLLISGLLYFQSMEDKFADIV
jgi:lipopolysaccharide transport system permease protein